MDSPARPANYRPTYVIEGTISRGRTFWNAVRSHISFWTVVLGIVFSSAVYLMFFSESMYVSEAIISLQNKGAMAAASSSILASSLSSAGNANQDAALVAYMTSHEMLSVLDKKFHLRELWSDYRRNPFWRLDSDASDEDFLAFYQGMIAVGLEPDTGLITVDILDYEPAHAKAMADTVIAEAERFMNVMSDEIRDDTLRAAKQELAEAEQGVANAAPQDRNIAELRFQSAEGAMATALSLANQQQVFVVRISNANLPTETTRPERFLDIASIALCSSVFYAIFFLILANIRDHRRL